MMESGLRAGLTSFDSLKEQNAKIQETQNKQRQQSERDHKQEQEQEEVVYRDKHGRKVEGIEDYLKKQEKVLEEQKKQQYEWGSGAKQRQEREEQRARMEEEKYKPLAQYADDADIDAEVRGRSRWGDPAAQFKAHKSSSSSADAVEDGKEVRPRYKGPPAPPNRFGIEPDYLWDGVDRSNGFEQKLFAMQATKSAQAEKKYFWSVADM